MRFHSLSLIALSASLLLPLPIRAASLPQVENVAVQPLLVQIERLAEALDFIGVPLSEAEKSALQAARSAEDTEARRQVQETLDAHCLAFLHINPESRVKVSAGPAALQLTEKGWRAFLIKVHNEAGVTAPLDIASPQARPLRNSPAEEVRDRWLEIDLFQQRPLAPSLSGLELEYRIVQLYSRDAGKRSAVLTFGVGQGSQDVGFRSDLMLTFDSAATQPVTFEILDEHGKPTTASLEIRDPLGRVYPSINKRLAPDFPFHAQIYRHSGESVKLPAGDYTIRCQRGPEYHAQTRQVTIGSQGSETVPVRFELERWIDPALMGWWSGDHHIHAAGCAHYTNPTEGVHAPDMMRHCLGEDLKIGANLTWGPCFDYQKQFFTGEIDPVSQYPYLLRYDVEVSGFGSHQSGHLCLLRLQDQIYPGGESKDHWPTLCLNTLKWAQKQGAVCGPAHSGWGLSLPSDDLPNYAIPPYDGIGACEYVVDVTHEVPGPDGSPVPAVDFMSTVDTPYPWELNIWYHTLNAGFQTRISGETDFPCIYDERVGLGRSYVKLPGELGYDEWCQGIEEGRAYVSDGYSHLIDFRINDVALGDGRPHLALEEGGEITASAKIAALLPETPDPSMRNRPTSEKPYWHIERARLGDSSRVRVELIVNGHPAESHEIEADGSLQDVSFKTTLPHSSWVALRILPSSHTNPIFISVNDKPIRASKRSIQWCLDSVDQLWSQKERFIAADEMEDALAAYEHTRQTYRRLLTETTLP